MRGRSTESSKKWRFYSWSKALQNKKKHPVYRGNIECAEKWCHYVHNFWVKKGFFVVKKLYKLKYSISSVFCVNLKYLDVWEGSLKISNIIENQKFWINILILSSWQWWMVLINVFNKDIQVFETWRWTFLSTNPVFCNVNAF